MLESFMPSAKKIVGASQADGERQRSGAHVKMKRLHVLVVDDISDNRELYAEYLAFKGLDVVTASDGKEALELASTMTFDVFVMDLALPLVDGWEVTRRLKSDERTRAIPLIAISGHVEPSHRLRAIEAGCDCYLTKPYLPADLHAEILRVLDERANDE